MWFSLSKAYLAQYFELNNIPFGQLVYWSVVTLPHFPKDHISGEICIKMGNLIFSGPELLLRERSSMCRQQVISRTLYLFILFIQYLKRCTLLAEIFIDNLGSVLILRGGGILYYYRKFTQKPELYQR